MILHVEDAEQGIGEDGELPPSIDELGTYVHEIEAVDESTLDDGRFGVGQVGLQQIQAVYAQLGEVRPGLTELFESFVACFREHVDKRIYHIAKAELLLPAANLRIEHVFPRLVLVFAQHPLESPQGDFKFELAHPLLVGRAQGLALRFQIGLLIEEPAVLVAISGQSFLECVGG